MRATRDPFVPINGWAIKTTPRHTISDREGGEGQGGQYNNMKCTIAAACTRCSSLHCILILGLLLVAALAVRVLGGRGGVKWPLCVPSLLPGSRTGRAFVKIRYRFPATTRSPIWTLWGENGPLVLSDAVSFMALVLRYKTEEKVPLLL